MPIEAWFYTPIYFDILREDKLKIVQQEISTAFAYTEDNNQFQKRKEWGLGNHSVSDTMFAQNIIQEQNLKNLKDALDFHIKVYIKNFTNYSYNISLISSWLTKTKTGESTATHNHDDCDISGVYYYKTNNNDGSIFFMNPLPSLITSNFLSSDEVVYYKPEVGKIILFPSWLYHGVRSNDTDDERVSLAFNYKVSK